ncbi:methyltransferase [Saccharopolyspora shandongensis]|uniref:methyltransferase n=1 Tax=Saccharopolyspora shandongensis TaxID=418495 RepID=UPI0033C08A4D
MLSSERVANSVLAPEEQRLQAVLATHPEVTQAVLHAETGADGRRMRTAYLLPKRIGAHPTDHGARTREYVEEWEAVYDYVYAGPEPTDATFDVRGWNSSFTGTEIAEGDMRDWVHHTVARIQGLGRERILELGCGTGLLLHRLAPTARRYVGSDVSQAAVDRIAQSFGGTPPGNVELHHAPADEVGFIAPGSVDCAVINSVTQYFLDETYLTKVLRQAVAAVGTGGAVYVGDVRSAALNRAFCTGLELATVDDSTPREQLQARVERRCCTGTELLIDPGYFTDLPAVIPRIAHVAILPKRSRRPSEMNRYRFDVVLSLDTPPARPTNIPEWRSWAAADMDLATLRHILQNDEPDALGFSDVRNARTHADHTAARLLQRFDGPSSAAEIRAEAESGGVGVDPEELWALAEKLPYTVELSWARSAPDGSFDVAFLRNGPNPRTAEFPHHPTPPRQHTNRLWHACAENLDPLQLRRYVRERLPGIPTPDRIVVLEEFPLTPNGEVDRSTLAAIHWA